MIDDAVNTKSVTLTLRTGSACDPKLTRGSSAESVALFIISLQAEEIMIYGYNR